MKIKANKILAVLCVIAMIMTMIVPMTLTAAAEETATITFDNTAKRTVYTTSQQVWTENNITVTNNKSASTNNVGDYSKPARFYASSNLVVEAPGNITTIVFDCNNATYATAMKNSIGTTASATVSSDKVTVTLDGKDSSFTVAKLTAQVRMDGITVTYAVDENACAHENYTTDELVEATCTEDGSWTYLCNDCGEEIHKVLKATGHNFVDEVCAECDAPEFTEMTIPEALSAKVGVGAIISNVTVDANYPGYEWDDELGTGSVYVKDEDGNTFLLFGLKTKVEIGNVITAKGYIGTYNNVNQLAAGGTAEILVSCPHTNTSVLEGKDPTCTETGLTEGEICDDCGVEIVPQEEIPANGHNFTDDTCSECGAAKPNSVTTSVTLKDYADANGWTNGTKYTSVNVNDVITATANGSSNTGKYYTNGNNWRLYQGESAKLVITSKDGATIISVKVSYETYNTGCLTYNGNTVASDTVIDVNGTSIEFVVGNTSTATNGQARITAIEVVYAVAAEDVEINDVDASLSVAYKYVENNGVLSNSQFVLKCGVDASLANVKGATAYGIAVTAGGKTVYYTSTAASWTVGDDVIYVSIALGDIINDTAKLSTEFTVAAFVEVDGDKIESTSAKTYSVAGMIDEYNDMGIEDVAHLYNVLVGYGLI